MIPAERRFMTSGLVTFVQGLVGKKVFAELRAGVIAIGILIDCDHYLNLRIRNAIILRARKAERFEEFFVSGRHLRHWDKGYDEDYCQASVSNKSSKLKKVD